MDKLKKIFSSSSDKEAKESGSDRRSSTKRSMDVSRGATGATGTGLTSTSAGESSSYDRRAEGFSSSAEQDFHSSVPAISEPTESSSSATKDINRPFAKDEPITSSTGLVSSATEGYTGQSGNFQHSDAATTASIKSGVQGTDLTGVSDSAQIAQPTTSTEYGSSGAGLTGTALADRSVEPTTSAHYEETSTFSTDSAIPLTTGPHHTFSGNRLDPAFNEDIPTYHEEVAESHKHKPTGAPALGATGMAATYVLSPEEAAQYQDASSISTAAYTTQGYSGMDTTTTRDTTTMGSTAGYGQEKSVDPSGPASETIGPHSSNLMNVIDPRVQPDPALMKGEASSKAPRDDYSVGTAGAAAYESDRPAAVERYEENTGSTESAEGYRRTGSTAGAAGVESSEYPVLHDLEQHEAAEDSDRRQTKGGVLGFLHGSQKGKYNDPEEPEVTAREKYFGQHAPRASGEIERGASTAGLATTGIAGVDSSQYQPREDLEHHEAIEERDRKQSKGGVFGVLHSSQRDKYDDPADPATSAKAKYFSQHARASGEHERESHVGRDAAALGAAGGVGAAAAYEYEQHSQPTAGTAEYDPYSSEHATSAALPVVATTTTTGTTGVYDPYAINETTGPTGFATGYAGESQGVSAPVMTSTTTTTTSTKPVVAAAAPVVAAATPEKKHTFGFLHRKDPNKLHKDPPGARSIDDVGDGRVIDSVTGLPMNVAKYGSGAGGIDGQKSIQGYEKNLNRERLASEGTADYEAIHKANVPY